MRPHRDDGVEARVVERKLGGVGLNDLEAALAGQPELVTGDVYSEHLPVMLREGGGVCAGAAANVQKPSRPSAEQAHRRIAWLVRELAGREHALVPVGNPVVARAAHVSDASLGVPGCLVVEAENTPARPDPGNAGEGSRWQSHVA